MKTFEFNPNVHSIYLNLYRPYMSKLSEKIRTTIEIDLLFLSNHFAKKLLTLVNNELKSIIGR
jgi:hypothetical protein